MTDMEDKEKDVQSEWKCQETGVQHPLDVYLETLGTTSLSSSSGPSRCPHWVKGGGDRSLRHRQLLESCTCPPPLSASPLHSEKLLQCCFHHHFPFISTGCGVCVRSKPVVPLLRGSVCGSCASDLGYGGIRRGPACCSSQLRGESWERRPSQ